MDGNLNSPGGRANPDRRVTDSLLEWEAQISRAPVGLSEVMLDANEKLLIPFTATRVKTEIHWVDYPSLRGYWRCNGPGCLLCRIGRPHERRELLPVYDVLAGAVGVLAIGPNVRPHALMPQLFPVLQRVLKNERVLIAVAKPDRQRYTVAVLDLPEDADAGEDAVLRFQEAFDAGTLDLAGVHQRLPNEVLAAAPEVATLMKLRGISQ